MSQREEWSASGSCTSIADDGSGDGHGDTGADEDGSRDGEGSGAPAAGWGAGGGVGADVDNGGKVGRSSGASAAGCRADGDVGADGEDDTSPASWVSVPEDEGLTGIARGRGSEYVKHRFERAQRTSATKDTLSTLFKQREVT